MQKERTVFGAFCPDQMGQPQPKEKLVPRSSSPVTVYVELPCIVEQALSTIAWDDFEDSASGVIHDSASLCFRANVCNSEDHDLQDYALDFMADSPATLESSLSPAELVPFQGCVIPPLTPQPDFSAEDSMVTHSDESSPETQSKANWKDIAHCHGSMLEYSVEVSPQPLEEKQKNTDCLQERNNHLKQLASRAKHLASVLEKLMTVSDLSGKEPAIPRGDKPSQSPCKRQRLDEGYETETSDSVEDMLRDISTRCNAVLHNAAATGTNQRQPQSIRMFGTFSGLQTSFSSTSMRTAGLDAEDSGLSFRASVREHSTIKTQAFSHGRAFTTRTQLGGYRFRWVPIQD